MRNNFEISTKKYFLCRKLNQLKIKIMYTVFSIVIIITSILLVLIVLIQNQKGGGLSSTFGGGSGNQQWVQKLLIF